VALLQLTVVAAAVASLVVWRYDDAAAFALVQVPPAAMAIVFVAVMIGDAVARTFLVSEQHDQDRRRDRAHAADRKAEASAAEAVTRATERWVMSWTALRTRIDVVLDEMRRVVGTGELIMLAERARRGAPAQAPVTVLPHGDRYLVPPTLDLPGGAVELRVVTDAARTLKDTAPTGLDADTQLTRLRELLALLLVDEEQAVLVTVPARRNGGFNPLTDERVALSKNGSGGNAMTE
jgi:hypothetical protein